MKVLVTGGAGLIGSHLVDRLVSDGHRCGAEGTEHAPPPRSDEQLEARKWEVRCSSCGAPLEPLPTLGELRKAMPSAVGAARSPLCASAAPVGRVNPTPAALEPRPVSGSGRPAHGVEEQPLSWRGEGR